MTTPGSWSRPFISFQASSAMTFSSIIIICRGYGCWGPDFSHNRKAIRVVRASNARRDTSGVSRRYPGSRRGVLLLSTLFGLYPRFPWPVLLPRVQQGFADSHDGAEI
jgi:hypothetical protein